MPRLDLDELRVRAERCLASAAPTTAEAHELAACALAALAALDATTSNLVEPAMGGPPYRTKAALDDEAAGDVGDANVIASLERALEAREMQLHAAFDELRELRARLGIAPAR